MGFSMGRRRMNHRESSSPQTTRFISTSPTFLNENEAIIPEVSNEVIIPKNIIYDHEDYYWFRRIGFTRELTDEQ